MFSIHFLVAQANGKILCLGHGFPHFLGHVVEIHISTSLYCCCCYYIGLVVREFKRRQPFTGAVQQR